MKSLSRALALALAAASVLTFSLHDLKKKKKKSRTVRFVLENCGNNLPRVVGSSVITPASVTCAERRRLDAKALSSLYFPAMIL